MDERAQYRQLALIRRFDEVALELRLGGEIEGVVHPYIGQEAIAVGVCAHLRRDDGMTSTHRGHGHCIAKGADPNRMMAELFGRRDGYCAGKGGSMHIADFEIGMLGANGIVAAGLPIATGAALAARLRGGDSVTACMFGEGAVGAGPFHEALNVAALWRLPLIFVCENNGWAVATAFEAGQAAASVAALAEPHGLAVEVVDGNDVRAVAAAAQRAVERGRAGAGPSLIEARTFRMKGHSYRVGAAPDRRDPELIARWAERDPLVAYRRTLISDGVLTSTAADELERAAADEVERAVAFARASPFPDPQDALSDVFAA